MGRIKHTNHLHSFGTLLAVDRVPRNCVFHTFAHAFNIVKSTTFLIFPKPIRVGFYRNIVGWKPPFMRLYGSNNSRFLKLIEIYLYFDFKHLPHIIICSTIIQKYVFNRDLLFNLFMTSFHLIYVQILSKPGIFFKHTGIRSLPFLKWDHTTKVLFLQNFFIPSDHTLSVTTQKKRSLLPFLFLLLR